MESLVYLILFICIITMIIVASIHQMIYELRHLNKTIIDMNIRNMKRMMRELNIQDANAYQEMKRSHLYLVTDNDKERS